MKKIILTSMYTLLFCVANAQSSRIETAYISQKESVSYTFTPVAKVTKLFGSKKEHIINSFIGTTYKGVPVTGFFSTVYTTKLFTLQQNNEDNSKNVFFSIDTAFMQVQGQKQRLTLFFKITF